MQMEFVIDLPAPQTKKKSRMPVPLPRHFKRAKAFHELNPHVYSLSVMLAREWVAAGETRLSIALIWEVLRKDARVSTKDRAALFKLENSYRSYYSRLIMDNEPDLDGKFVTRKLNCEK